MSRQPPFNLTQIEIDNLPKKWQDWHLENSSLARTWSETLHEAVLTNQIIPQLAHKLLYALMPATVRAWSEHTWRIPEVQMQSGPVVSYNRNDDVYKFVLEDVTLTLPPGEPNPMDGYLPSPQCKGYISNQLKLTRCACENENEDGDTNNANGATDALKLAFSPPVSITEIKRNHSAMVASLSTSTAVTHPPSCSSKVPGKLKGSKPLIITIPRLTIIIYPSGFYKHHDALPIKDRPALRQAAKQFDKDKMEGTGLKRVVQGRVAREPRKRAKTREKVAEEDLREDIDGRSDLDHDKCIMMRWGRIWAG